MGVIQTYAKIIKKRIPKSPEKAYKLITTGLALEKFRSRHLSDKRLPKAFKYLNTFAVNEVLQALKDPKNTVWANIFAPVEILQNFGVHVLSVETLSSFLSGFTLEDYFLDYAESRGIAPTLCSYHRNFTGAVDSLVIPPAAFATTTSTICDGNICTFRHLSEHHNVPNYIIDVPEMNTPEAVPYLVTQLRELIVMLEDTFGKRFDEDELKACIKRENRSKEYYEKYLKNMRTRAYPGTLTIQMYMLFASHLNTGSSEILKFYRMLAAESSKAPEFKGVNLLWVHLLPYYQETLKNYINLSDKYRIQTIELNLDYRKPLDPEKPLESLAEKMIGNIYTGSYERKAELVKELALELNSDGVINFCHWGCKQSSGGIAILKEKMQEIDMPFLVLDGDGIDRRNSHDAQIKTRFEAFLELIEKRKETEK